MMKRKLTISKLLLAVASTAIAQAEISTPSFFSDGMVLQRETESNIWGTANANAEVSVSFAGQTLKTTADKDGAWKVTFKGLKTAKQGSTLNITSGEDKKAIEDVLVGEVWVASGQSNMSWSMSKTHRAQVAETIVDPLLRFYTGKETTAAQPQTDFVGTWKSTKPENTPSLPATAWEFAKRLRDELDIPVGMIKTSWGGKPIEPFISVEALQEIPEGKICIDQKIEAISKWNLEEAMAKFEKDKAAYKVKYKAWKKAGDTNIKPPKKIKKPEPPSLRSRLHSTIYNGMIAPITGYGIRGAIWYQGESNVHPELSKNYQELLTCLIKDWRTRWGSDFSFYFVQLANFKGRGEEAIASNEAGAHSSWVSVQDEMRKTVNDVEKTGIAIINDIGEADDIHPRNKQDVGDRLARWALAKDYGKTGFSISGPLYSSHKIEGNKFVISFDHAKGLKSRDGKDIARLEITDGNGNWKWAQGKLNGETLEVWHDAIAAPTRVRYAWASNPTGANLVNGEGLPASCFDTAAE